jgi:hypothetical protein
MKKTKQQLIEEANSLASEHQFKKDVIEKMLNDLDEKKNLTPDHLEAMGIIQNILNEMDELERAHQGLIKQIKN